MVKCSYVFFTFFLLLIPLNQSKASSNIQKETEFSHIKSNGQLHILEVTNKKINYYINGEILLKVSSKQEFKGTIKDVNNENNKILVSSSVNFKTGKCSKDALCKAKVTQYGKEENLDKENKYPATYYGLSYAYKNIFDVPLNIGLGVHYDKIIYEYYPFTSLRIGVGTTTGLLYSDNINPEAYQNSENERITVGTILLSPAIYISPIKEVTLTLAPQISYELILSDYKTDDLEIQREGGFASGINFGILFAFEGYSFSFRYIKTEPKVKLTTIVTNQDGTKTTEKTTNDASRSLFITSIGYAF